MKKLEKKAEPDHVRPGSLFHYLNPYLKLTGVSLKVVKQKFEMEYVHVIIFCLLKEHSGYRRKLGAYRGIGGSP